MVYLFTQQEYHKIISNNIIKNNAKPYEVIARNKDGRIKTWDEIAEEIRADSLAYSSMDSLSKAIGFDICRGCIDFPDGYPTEMKEDVKQLFKIDRKGIRAYES